MRERLFVQLRTVVMRIISKSFEVSARKITQSVLDRFPRNFFIQSAIVNDKCMQKIKIGHRAKFRDRDNFFPQVLFPFRAILRRIFTSGVLHALLLIEI